MVEADATRRTSSEFDKNKTQQMKPTHFNVVMSMIFMYKQDVLTLDQLHECLEKYEIRPRRKRKSRAKPYKVTIGRSRRRSSYAVEYQASTTTGVGALVWMESVH